jgi:hypothetical protein
MMESFKDCCCLSLSLGLFYVWPAALTPNGKKQGCQSVEVIAGDLVPVSFTLSVFLM